MIFVALGTQKFQMNRLLMELDALVEAGKLTEPVFAQIGNSDYVPRSFPSAAFLDTDAFDSYIANCDLLITHGGVSTIVKGLKLDKPTVVCPRLAAFKEHVDDHQKQIAEGFTKKNYVLACEDMAGLLDAVTESRTHTFDKYVSQRSKMLELVGNYLESLEGGKRIDA